MFSKAERLSQTAATIVAGILYVLVGYGLLWFTNLANSFPHGWGYIWYLACLIGAGIGFIMVTAGFLSGFAVLIIGVLGAILTGYAIDRPIDDKLWAGAMGSTWSYIVILAIALIGVLLYLWICAEEAIFVEDQWYLLLLLTIAFIIGAVALGMLFGLLGFQATLPTPGW